MRCSSFPAPPTCTRSRCWADCWPRSRRAPPTPSWPSPSRLRACWRGAPACWYGGCTGAWRSCARRGGWPARAEGELFVLADDFPDAYALPGRPGRIVVTSGMLRALSAAEREALLAHERAHLTGRHHLFTAAVELAALCHPALRALREPLAYALERCADEDAAHAVGDRRLTAQAIGKAALAARAAHAACPAAAGRRPGISLAATAGPVPRRVTALLDQHAGTAPTRRDTRIAIAAVLLACLALSTSSAVEAADDLHTSIEVAQGELPG
ncbi:M56 family metallopeptidase [Streptomyces sp. NPDC058290]|uniref:M56 family metallopeptidase n=1 Tax=Streptomyces sp. NPDC058290 TaxID=3346426 RepID=UPI0036E22B45